MQFTDFTRLDLQRLPSPCFVVDEVSIERNLKILQEVEQRSGAKVLQALKAFSMWSLAPLTRHYLSENAHQTSVAYSSVALKIKPK